MCSHYIASCSNKISHVLSCFWYQACVTLGWQIVTVSKVCSCVLWRILEHRTKQFFIFGAAIVGWSLNVRWIISFLNQESVEADSDGKQVPPMKFLLRSWSKIAFSLIDAADLDNLITKKFHGKDVGWCIMAIVTYMCFYILMSNSWLLCRWFFKGQRMEIWIWFCWWYIPSSKPNCSANSNFYKDGKRSREDLVFLGYSTSHQ